ncbi:hypothetical protein KAX17_11030 [Candidatus Bipolaricaulota bacterium]|nr:hypothetical protein [Candidatus Bipolaricaulota bacterium]
MCEWQSEVDPSYRCRVPPEPGSNYCILHEPGAKNVARFNDAIGVQIASLGSASSRNPRFSFAGYVFPKGVFASNKWATWQRAEACIPDVLANPDFSETTIFGEAFFSGAKITGQADFRHAKVSGKANFVDARVGNLAFQHAELGEDAWLSLAAIGMAYFAHAHVKGNVLLENAEITNSISLTDVQIDGDLILTQAKIGGSVLLHGGVVHKDLNLMRAVIGGSLHLHRARILGDLTLQEATIHHRARLTFGELGGKLWCLDCRIGTALWLPPPEVAIGTADFDGCTAKHLKLGDGKPRLLGWGAERCGIRIEDHASAVSFWRFAQRAFASEGKRHEADVSFYFERMARWKELRTMVAPDGSGKAKRTIARLMRVWYGLLWPLDLVFLRYTTAYGASLGHLVATWLLVIWSFGVWFSLSPRLIGHEGASVWTLRNWINGIHYSVTTFATLGLGDLKPGASSLGKVLTSVEALLGAVLVALAVVVVARRFMRQG